MTEIYNTILLFPLLYVFSKFNRALKHISGIFLYTFFTVIPEKNLPVSPNYQSDKERYICKHTKKYLSLFDVDPAGIIYNSNILPVFYLRKDLTEVLADVNNNIEKSWRTRVLIETTPYGMVIMYYDAFKEGFSYYSNQTGIPYDIMNAVVMKYVYMFRCRDFFIDETVNTDKHVSPFLLSMKIEEKKEQRKKRDAAMKLNKGVKIGMGGDMPFVKFRRNSTSSITDKNTQANKGVFNPVLFKKDENDARKESTSDNIVYKNKIIFLGKTANYNFLIPVNDTRQCKKRVVKIKDLKNDMLFNNLFNADNFILNTVKDANTCKNTVKPINYDVDNDSNDSDFFTESSRIENNIPFGCDQIREPDNINMCGKNCGYGEEKNGDDKIEDKTGYAYYKKNKQNLTNIKHIMR